MTLYRGPYCMMDRFMVYLASGMYSDNRETRAEHLLERAIYARLGGQLALDQRWHDQWVDRKATVLYFNKRRQGLTPSAIVLSQVLEEEGAASHLLP